MSTLQPIFAKDGCGERVQARLSARVPERGNESGHLLLRLIRQLQNHIFQEVHIVRKLLTVEIRGLVVVFRGVAMRRNPLDRISN